MDFVGPKRPTGHHFRTQGLQSIVFTRSTQLNIQISLNDSPYCIQQTWENINYGMRYGRNSLDLHKTLRGLRYLKVTWKVVKNLHYLSYILHMEQNYERNEISSAKRVENFGFTLKKLGPTLLNRWEHKEFIRRATGYCPGLRHILYRTDFEPEIEKPPYWGKVTFSDGRHGPCPVSSATQTVGSYWRLFKETTYHVEYDEQRLGQLQSLTKMIGQNK